MDPKVLPTETLRFMLEQPYRYPDADPNLIKEELAHRERFGQPRQPTTIFGLPYKPKNAVSPEFRLPAAEMGSRHSGMGQNDVPPALPGYVDAPPSYMPQSKPPAPGTTRPRPPASTPATVGLPSLRPDVAQLAPEVQAPGEAAPANPFQTTTEQRTDLGPDLPMPEGKEDPEGELRRQAKWLALMQLGFGMMASKNPRFFGALGEGGMAATKEYGDVLGDARKEGLLKAENRKLTEMERQNKASEGLAKEKLETEKDHFNRVQVLREADQNLKEWLHKDPASPEVQKAKAALMKAQADVAETETKIKTYYPAVAGAYGASAALHMSQANKAESIFEGPDGQARGLVGGRVVDLVDDKGNKVPYGPFFEKEKVQSVWNAAYNKAMDYNKSAAERGETNFKDPIGEATAAVESYNKAKKGGGGGARVDESKALNDARAVISRNPKARPEVERRLKEAGIDPSKL